MASKVYKTPRVSNSGDIYTRETTSVTPDGALLVTAWTDEAWNRALEANRRYLATQEWQRAHPFLEGVGRAINGVGNFINDEIFLNKNNIRVRNAQLHPEGLKWFREGGNEAAAFLGLSTAPMWVPELVSALPTLPTVAEGSLFSTVVPLITSRIAPNLANLLNYGAIGAGALTLGRILSDNPQTLSIPSSYSGIMAIDAPTDSVAPANPTAPTDRVSSTPTSAPGPEPERNDSTSQRSPSLREREGDRIAGRNRQQTSTGSTPPNNNQNGSFLGRMLWETKNNNFGPNWWRWRNVGRVGLGLSYPAREIVWPAAWKGLKYMTVGPDSVPPTQPKVTTPSAVTLPVDSGYVAPDQYVTPTDTLDF